jgi:hypothetical protein
MLGANVFAASNTPVKAASDPIYNPATVTHIDGVIAAVRTVPTGPLAGVHVVVKTKTGNTEVYLAPSDFLRIFRVSFPVGNEIEVIGSKVKVENNDVILSRDIAIGAATISLRDANGAENWKNWGVEIDPSAVRY